MPLRQREAVVILLDVGSNAAEKSNDSTFFERAKECAKKIILRKIFSSPNDEIGIILFGSDKTSNNLNASFDGYEGIVEMGEMELPSWRLLKKLEKVECSKISSSNWVDGMLVALNYFTEETKAKKFTNSRIILLTNFKSEIEEADVDIIIQNVNDDAIELIAVSDTIEYEDTDKLSGAHFTQNTVKTQVQTSSETIFNRMSEKINTVFLCHIEQVELQLLHYQKRAKKPFPWNSQLTIGKEFRINISAYVYVKREPLIDSFKTECYKSNTVTKLTTTYKRNNEEIAKPDEQDIINAYMYGGEICPVDENMKYDSGKKCLSCIGFAKERIIAPQYLCGDGCHIVVPRKNSNSKSKRLFASLVHEMHRLKFVMIARKVYRSKTKCHIVLLRPQIKDNATFLIMIELPFADDLIFTQFPFLNSEKNKPTEEQNKAMKDLINSMDLMNAIDDDSGVNELQINFDPLQQHLCNVIAYRALHPNQPLPPFNNELRKLFDVPEKIKNESRETMKNIDGAFKLEIVTDREKKRPFGQKERKVSEDDDIEMVDESEYEEKDKNPQKITQVGTVTPAEDFIYLVKHSLERYNVLCEQIQNVIYQFMFKTLGDFKEKLKETILSYREMAKIHFPFEYNKFLKDLKELMIKHNKTNEWYNIIAKEGLGVISNQESPLSTVSFDDQVEFYEIALKKTDKVTALGEEEEVDELEALLD